MLRLEPAVSILLVCSVAFFTDRMDAGRSDFYDYPDLYDALLPVGAEVPFYVDLARQQAGAVLELACGTGQLTIPIALQGLPTVGLDQSRAMLDAAKRRASAVSASVAFLQVDMRDFAFGREFNLDHSEFLASSLSRLTR